MREETLGRPTAPLVWLNLVCLDAPLVAISWQWLFARSLGIPIAPGVTLALFLTAWLIYLADRFGDSLSLEKEAPTSLRQRFCVRHRAAWMAAMALVTVADLWIIARELDERTIRSGAAVGAFAVAYLWLNQRRPSAWRLLPLKETSVGFLFGAGAMVGLEAGLTSVTFPAWLLFAGLCTLNCISIAVWERALDRAQGRLSVATLFPTVERFLLPLLILLASGALGFAAWSMRPVGVAVGASALLLATVHSYRDRIGPDVRTALADLVLLSPLGWWAASVFL